MRKADAQVTSTKTQAGPLARLMNRLEMLLIVEVKDSNPNGNPDGNGDPREDSETKQGLITDVCMKHKSRNFVLMTKAGAPGFDCYVKNRAVLHSLQAQGYRDLGLTLTNAAAKDEDGKKPKGKKATDVESADTVRDYMCQKYWDVRTFGAVMASKEANAGTVRGPVQMSFGRSADPITISDHCLTRCAVATEKEAEDQGGENRMFGRKSTVHYGLYVFRIHVNPFLALETGCTREDIELYIESLLNACEFDRSAARVGMNVRKLIMFEHETALGNARSADLFDLVKIERKPGVELPRAFSDYSITIGSAPKGVKITTR